MIKQKFTYSLLIIFIIISILSCTSFGSPSRPPSGPEYKMVLETKNANTIEAYKKYFNEYPEGHYYQEMKVYQKDLQADIIVNEEYSKVNKIGTKEAFENFLEKYSTVDPKLAYYVKISIEALKLKEEEEAFTKLHEYNNIERYKNFLTEYPDSKYREEIEKEIEYLNEKQRQEDLRLAKQLKNKYEIALDNNTIEAMANFLSGCSDREYIKKANMRIANLKLIESLEIEFNTSLHLNWMYYNLSNPYGFIKNEAYAFFIIDIFQWLNEDEILARSYPFEGSDIFHIRLGSIDRTQMSSQLSDIIAIYLGSFEYSSNSGIKIVPSFKLVRFDSGVLR